MKYQEVHLVQGFEFVGNTSFRSDAFNFEESDNGTMVITRKRDAKKFAFSAGLWAGFGDEEEDEPEPVAAAVEEHEEPTAPTGEVPEQPKRGPKKRGPKPGPKPGPLKS